MNASIAHDFVLEPDDIERLANLCGPLDQHLRLIEGRLNVEIGNRGNVFRVSGPAENAHDAERLLRALYRDTESAVLTRDALELRLGAIDAGSSDVAEVAIKVKRGMLRGRGVNQQRYLHAVVRHAINFGIGPAGTGKTYLAVASAVEALNDSRVQRLILVRPAVEAGEKLGFLPGDLSQKVDPYLRPLYDALYEMLGVEKVAKLIERNVIEIAPLSIGNSNALFEQSGE